MEEKQITLQIDGHFITVPEGSTILEAACKIGINIPTLCHIDLKGTCIKNNPASCRICVVEVAGRRNLAPACATRCTEGMVVKTSTLRVMNARKVVAELILSDHPNDCLTCPKCGNCELQTLALRFNIREMPFNGGELSPRKREVTSSIVRNMDKCIFCRRCESVCNDVQTVGALGAICRGFNTTIAPAFDRMMKDSECTYCGQCVAVCPVGALTERDYTNRLLDDLADPDKIVIVQTAPAVRAALGEEFGLPPGTLVTGKMVYALRELGFDYVFDTDFAADLTIMEEGSEILNRLTRYLDGDKSVRLPILTSCCPAWVNFFEHHFPDMLDIPSTARSPQQMFGSIAKSYWAEKMGIPREKLVVVSIMPCLAKKYECDRDEFKVNGVPDVDYSISTRELARLIKRQTYDTGIGNLLHDFFGRKLTFFDQCLATVNGFFPFVAFYINKDSRFCITARIDYCINLRHFSTDRRVNCCRNEAGRFGNLRAYLHHITFCYYRFGRCANVLPQQNNCLCRNFRCDDRLMCRQFIFVWMNSTN